MWVKLRSTGHLRNNLNFNLGRSLITILYVNCPKKGALFYCLIILESEFNPGFVNRLL